MRTFSINLTFTLLGRFGLHVNYLFTAMIVPTSKRSGVLKWMQTTENYFFAAGTLTTKRLQTDEGEKGCQPLV